MLSLPALEEAGVRSHPLPSTVAPDERVGEPDDDVVGSASDLSRAMRAAGHDGGISKDPHIHIVYIDSLNPVQASLEHVGQDAGSVRHPPVRSGAPPIGRDDPLDGRSVAADPCFSQRLLQGREHMLVRRCTGLLRCAVSRQGRYGQERQN
jgi:hypothetical protein